MKHRVLTRWAIFVTLLVSTTSNSAVPTTLSENDRIEALRQGEHFIDLWNPAPAAEVALRLMMNGRKDAEACRLAALAAFYQ